MAGRCFGFSHQMAAHNGYLLLLLLQLSFSIVTAQNINVTSSLIAGDNSSWISSPSQDFAFGFHQLDQDSFLLAIWYHNLRPETTTVWYANGDNPAPRNSRLELTHDRGLVLTDPQGSQLWSTNSSAPVGYAVMNDMGNLVIMDRNSTSIWESFDHPTDTLLPSQIMRPGGFLSSRKSNSNFSRGRYRFGLVTNVTNAVFQLEIQNITEVYGGLYENIDIPVTQVIFNQTGNLYALRKNGDISIYMTPGIEEGSNLYRRVSLNFDGVLSSYYHSRDPSESRGWFHIQSIPEDICTNHFFDHGGGPCGYNSICTTRSDGRTDCKCPYGYSPIDPSDANSGCTTNFSVGGCGSDSTQNQSYYMREFPNTDWPSKEYDSFHPASKENCTVACLHDCLCAAAVFAVSTCWKKMVPLSNGREKPGAAAFLKLLGNYTSSTSPPSPNFPHIQDPRDQDTLVIVVSSLLGTSLLVNLMVFCGICMIFFFRKKKLFVGSANGSSVNNNLRNFTFKELTQATNGFKEEIGRGSCGIVYKGEMRDAGLIAVKMLDRVFEDSEKEFKAEVEVIGQTHHKNLVRLAGYCDEKQQRLLVYEFFKNGTLASFLYGDPKPSWKQRIEIAFGIARGLVYLHEECIKQIIHCDIKPQNILLDDNYNARISDFGMAKLLLINQSHTKTNVRGTKGYVAPDWFRSAPVSVKVDVYSFGVVLLEIVCCRRNVKLDADEHKRVLTDYAYDCFIEGNLDALVENDVEAIGDIKMVERFVMVAIWCLQENPNIRPTMKKVMLMLEGELQVSAPPTPFSFTSQLI